MHPLARMDEVTIYHGGLAVVLRPTLRAAITLEQMHGGWSGLISKLEQRDSTVTAAVIRASASDRSAAEVLLRIFSTSPLSEVAKAVSEPLSALLGMFFAPTWGSSEAKETGKPAEWSEVYVELYRYGTGWLGWTPVETWASTPTEIVQAFEGKVAHLIAVNGGSAEKVGASSDEYTPARLKQIEQDGFDPAFDRAALQALKAKA